MYFLTTEDHRLLHRGLLPQARRLDVPEDLRGWSWTHAPLEPAYPVRLGVSEVAGAYCATARDLYLRRVLHTRPQSTEPMRTGARLHRLVTELMVSAKRRLYALVDGSSPEALRGLRSEAADASPDQQLAVYIEDCLVAEAALIMSRQPRIGVDALVARLIPASFDMHLDGSVLGLSRHLAADAIAGPWPTILELKFGALRDFHRLSTTGYALAYEATHEVPVNLACVIGVTFERDTVLVDRDYHLVDADLRQRFVETRDERAAMIYHESDPGLAAIHPPTCPYLADCQVAPTALHAIPPLQPQPSRPTPIAPSRSSTILFPGSPQPTAP
ncbi:MAG: type I-A CRISPR-associated protein Cas4/Csa1 [Egibacteraceae bacterium]